jgi:hypothetical protein
VAHEMVAFVRAGKSDIPTLLWPALELSQSCKSYNGRGPAY